MEIAAESAAISQPLALSDTNIGELSGAIYAGLVEKEEEEGKHLAVADEDVSAEGSSSSQNKDDDNVRKAGTGRKGKGTAPLNPDTVPKFVPFLHN